MVILVPLNGRERHLRNKGILMAPIQTGNKLYLNSINTKVSQIAPKAEAVNEDMTHNFSILFAYVANCTICVANAWDASI